MRPEGTVVCTLIAEQVVCTKLAAFSSDLPGVSSVDRLYRQTFVLVNKPARCLVLRIDLTYLRIKLPAEGSPMQPIIACPRA